MPKRLRIACSLWFVHFVLLPWAGAQTPSLCGGLIGNPQQNTAPSLFTGHLVRQFTSSEIHQLRQQYPDHVNAVADSLFVTSLDTSRALAPLLDIMKKKLTPFAFVSDEDSRTLALLARYYHRLYSPLQLRPDEVLLAISNGTDLRIQNGSSLRDRLMHSVRAVLARNRALTMHESRITTNAERTGRRMTVTLFFDRMVKSHGYTEELASWALEDVVRLGDKN